MINMTLYKKEWKSNGILLLIFMAILSIYSYMIIAMFEPQLGDSLKVMAESMPELFAAFGMLDVGTTLLEFITGYLYGFLFIVFPCVFIIILTNRLIARYVDQGSMIYLLCTPVKRRKIAETQACFLFSTLIFLTGYLVALIILVSHFMFPGELETAAFLRMNVGLLGTYIFFGGVGFCISCIFNESRKVLTISTAVVVYSLLVQMISQVGDKFENLKYITPLTLFSPEKLAASEPEAWTACIFLYIIGFSCVLFGIFRFEHRNLSI